MNLVCIQQQASTIQVAAQTTWMAFTSPTGSYPHTRMPNWLHEQTQQLLVDLPSSRTAGMQRTAAHLAASVVVCGPKPFSKLAARTPMAGSGPALLPSLILAKPCQRRSNMASGRAQVPLM